MATNNKKNKIPEKVFFIDKEDAKVVLHTGHKHKYVRDPQGDTGGFEHWICYCRAGRLVKKGENPNDTQDS